MAKAERPGDRAKRLGLHEMQKLASMLGEVTGLVGDGEGMGFINQVWSYLCKLRVFLDF